MLIGLKKEKIIRYHFQIVFRYYFGHFPCLGKCREYSFFHHQVQASVHICTDLFTFLARSYWTSNLFQLPHPSGAARTHVFVMQVFKTILECFLVHIEIIPLCRINENFNFSSITQKGRQDWSRSLSSAAFHLTRIHNNISGSIVVQRTPIRNQPGNCHWSSQRSYWP